MSQSSSQAWAFYREVAKSKIVWTLRDDDGYPAPLTGGKRAHPFWSSRSRVETVIETVPAYAGFRPVEISWSDFCSRWVPGLTSDGLLVGVNWSGKSATGYDVEPAQLQRYVEAIIENPSECFQPPQPPTEGAAAPPGEGETLGS